MKKTDINELGKPEDWDYLNEGNLNVICRYIGKNAKLKGYVFRVKKNTHSTAFSGNYGIDEPQYRKLFFTGLQAYPKLLSYFPEDVFLYELMFF